MAMNLSVASPLPSSNPPSAVPLEVRLERDRTVVAVSLVAIAALAWTYLLYLASRMGGLGMSTGMALPQMDAWGPVELLLTFVMWSVMMVAMMIPSAAPMILLFTNINRTRREREASTLPTATFVSGYLLVWTGLSALATLTQWGLHDAGLLSPMMRSSSSLVSGTFLIAAGCTSGLRGSAPASSTAVLPSISS